MEEANQFGAVIPICMGTTQGNSLCSSLYLKLTKCHVSHFIFYVFSSTKLENRRVEQVGGVGDRGRRMNMVQTNVYTCM
jgi:hypothetical protein